jgi:Peptidase family M23
MRSGPRLTVVGMRPITLICALAAALQLLSSDATATPGWTWPIRGPVLTQYRNGPDPYAGGQHRGIDIGAPVGSRVVAATAGTVTFAGVVGSSGLTVSERTADGRFDLSYLHLSSAGVHRGDVLSPGAAVGAVGVSGRRSVLAPHLHFGVREAGSRSAYRDPLDFLAPPPAERAPRPTPAPVPVRHPAAPAQARVRLHRVRTPHTVPSPALATHAFLEHAPRLHTSQHATHRSNAPEPQRGPEAAPVRTPALPAPHHHPSAASHGGINLGWLMACLGLIAAATALGRPDATRKLANHGRTRLTALLHPASRAR